MTRHNLPLLPNSTGGIHDRVVAGEKSFWNNLPCENVSIVDDYHVDISLIIIIIIISWLALYIYFKIDGFMPAIHSKTKMFLNRGRCSQDAQVLISLPILFSSGKANA